MAHFPGGAIMLYRRITPDQMDWIENNITNYDIWMIHVDGTIEVGLDNWTEFDEVQSCSS
jgi:hypothetical protein